MSSKPTNTTNLKAADLTGESEEFVLPKAPPLPQAKTIRHAAPSQSEDQWLPPAGEVAGDNAPIPEIPATPKSSPRKLPPLQRHESPVHGNRSEASLRAEGKKPDEEGLPETKPQDSETGRSGLVGVIVILVLVIVGLLIFMANSESQKTTTNPIVSSIDENKARIDELQSENETMRRQLVEMTAQAKQLKEQLRTLSNARDEAVSDLDRANDVSSKESAALRAEVVRLESLVRNSRPPQETTSTARDPLPDQQVVGTVYRVSGLREGDTLNVRSGPGAGFSVVTQLQLGVRVTVTGAAVANGPDWWLPCYLSGKVTNHTTGESKPWAAKGWINSAFLEKEG